MKQIKCPCESCNKEFEKPIVVTNFSFAPKNETYYACPYCLTKIDSLKNECDCTPIIDQESGCAPDQSTRSRRVLGKSNVFESVMLEKLETLEKERANLLLELEELRNGAMQKICNLTEDVSTLREEKKILKKLAE